MNVITGLKNACRVSFDILVHPRWNHMFWFVKVSQCHHSLYKVVFPQLDLVVCKSHDLLQYVCIYIYMHVYIYIYSFIQMHISQLLKLQNSANLAIMKNISPWNPLNFFWSKLPKFSRWKSSEAATAAWSPEAGRWSIGWEIHEKTTGKLRETMANPREALENLWEDWWEMDWNICNFQILYLNRNVLTNMSLIWGNDSDPLRDREMMLGETIPKCLNSSGLDPTKKGKTIG